MNLKRSYRRALAVVVGRAWLAMAAVGGAGCGALHAAETLTLATYNVQNYNLENRQLADGGGFRPDYPKPEAEKAALRAVIRSLDADVIALQEMGGAQFLEELRQDLATEGVNYPYGDAMLAADEKRGLAVLSRIPLGQITAHRDLVGTRPGGDKNPSAEPVRRGLLEVRVPWTGGEVTLFVLHLKSRLTDDKTDPAAEEQRAAEAVAVREQILRGLPQDSDAETVSKSARFVVMGDFNDAPGSRPLRAMQAKGKREIARWIDAADSRGHRWTHAYARQASYSRFDHALVSPALAASVERAWIGDTPETALASDHRPLILRLRAPRPGTPDAKKSGAQ
jgi:endonuclease/exonuclease/phosphatase family metal-dependent hydrolase